MPFSVNIKTDVVDFDAGTNISADTVDELKQNLTDFIQSGVVDLVNRAALAARARGHAAKKDQAGRLPQTFDDLAQAIGNVQQVFPQATQIPEPEQAAVYVQPAPPVPQASVPAGVEFQEGGPNGTLKLFLPFKQNLDFRAMNEALRSAGARGVKSPNGNFEKWKSVPREKQADVLRVVSQFFG